MADMNVSLELNTETIEKITRAASCVGQDIPTFLQNYLKQSFAGESMPHRSLNEILAPFRAEIDQSGLADPQLDALFTQARDGAFADRRRHGQ
jgi:uncharacterized phage protein gp47/JayE